MHLRSTFQDMGDHLLISLALLSLPLLLLFTSKACQVCPPASSSLTLAGYITLYDTASKIFPFKTSHSNFIQAMF